MYYFKRTIDNIDIKILIDSAFFIEHINIFNAIFSTFQKEITNNQLIINEKGVILIQKVNNLSTKYESIKKFLCNTFDDNWILKLIGDLEEYYANLLNCTVIHGSCVDLNNKNILFIGARKHGKTTLTSYLSLHKNATYLDDDCVYLFNDEFYGFNMPIAVRNDVDKLNKNMLVCTSIDGENITRKLFNTPKKAFKFSSVDIIIFPHYSYTSTNEIELVQKKFLFNMIINNVRHSKNSYTLFVDINKMVKNVQAYKITYSSSEIAYSMVNKIIEEKERCVNENILDFY